MPLVHLRPALVAAMLALAGCAAPQGGAVSPMVVPATYHVVPVFYATDRSYDPTAPAAQRYGGGRGDMSYGIVQVSIPRDHRVGALETPSLWHLEFRADPERHVVLVSVSRDPKGEFLAKLRQAVRIATRRDAFVFIHGYDTSFEDAARRTAQLAYDLDFSGVPILYTWPSQGELMKYLVDTNNADWTVPHLEQFLADVAAKSGASTIHLIGHSLGNRVLVAALEGYARRVAGGAAPPFAQVVLTAPDIDTGIFRQHAAHILAAARHVTMYASQNDLALHASESLAEFPRAGDTRYGVVVINGMDTIDASGVDTSFLGHAYFADNGSVISDIHDLLDQGAVADHRSRLRAVAAQTGRYWIFPTGP